jgi:predicted DNA-binding protein
VYPRKLPRHACWMEVVAPTPFLDPAEQPAVHCSFRLAQDDVERLDALVVRLGRSRSEVIRFAITCLADPTSFAIEAASRLASAAEVPA